jgi:hypothetical protein
MNTYLISYDLRVPETSEDYKKLIAYIKSFPSWAKPLYSVWLIKTDKTASQIRDEIGFATDANDRTLVIDVTGRAWATKGVSEEIIKWMKDNL